MCGRFVRSSSAAAIAKVFGVAASDIPASSYNIAPTQSVAAIVRSPDAGLQLQSLRWGLIPSWAKDSAIGSKLINARAETIAEKPSFRSAFRQRRCLIVADGFYEWQQVPSSRQKQPYFIGLQDEGLFAFAGLYEHWHSSEGEILNTCTIITTAANELIEPIHNRMPVLLAPQNYELWLDNSSCEVDRLQGLLAPYPAAAMQVYPVSRSVNSPKNNSPECKQPQLP